MSLAKRYFLIASKEKKWQVPKTKRRVYESCKNHIYFLKKITNTSDKPDESSVYKLYIYIFFIIYPAKHINNEFLNFLPFTGPLFTKLYCRFLRAHVVNVTHIAERRATLSFVDHAESHQNRNVIIIMKQKHPKRLT